VNTYTLSTTGSVCHPGSPDPSIVPKGQTIHGVYYGTRNGTPIAQPFTGTWITVNGVLQPIIYG
jgi:hypothetical protein